MMCEGILDVSNHRNRGGSFACSRALVQSAVEGKDTGLFAQIMSQVIITKAEYDYVREQFNYTGYSPLFRELGANEIQPVYQFIVQTAPGNQAIITAEEIK